MTATFSVFPFSTPESKYFGYGLGDQG